MRIAVTRPLFDWQSLEDSPTLASVRELLASIPDCRLLQGLAEHRGRGRDDYPVTVLWGAVLLTVLLRHKDFESCLAELRRNEGLRRLDAQGTNNAEVASQRNRLLPRPLCLSRGAARARIRPRFVRGRYFPF
jgi:hypothetical protein